MNSTGDTTGVPKEFHLGDVVGGTYVVIGYIGHGAMGDVYHVKHAVLNTEYALKTLSSDKVTDVDWKRFQLEAQAISLLNHPNLVSLYNLGMHNGIQLYYVMELLQGIDLGRKLRQDGPLGLRTSVHAFIEVCSGISYAHKKGIVHRDLKPGNIFLLEKSGAFGETVKVVDFGVAKILHSKDQAVQSLTGVGDVVGTPYYMSPEQTMGERVDMRSDIYSLGCTLYEALTGTLPFRGRNPTETMLLHQTTAAPSLSKASGKEFPASIEYVVATAMAKSPADRYQTMEQLANELVGILESGKVINVVAGGATVEALPVESERPIDSGETGAHPAPQKTSIPVLIGTAISLIALLSVGVWQWRSNQEQAKQPGLTEQLQKLSPNPAAKASENSDTEKEAFAKQTSELEATKELFPHQIVTASLLLKTPFSTKVTENGKTFRIFKFPKDVVIGLISVNKIDAPIRASGELKFDVDQLLTFTPTEVVGRAPNCLKRFQVGDIYGIKFDPKSISDSIFAATTNIPEVKKLDFTGCWGLTAKSLETMRKFQNLTDVDCSYSNIDGTLIAQSYNWEHLNRFLMARGHHVKEMLDNFEEAKRLRHLCLAESRLRKEDLESLADLKQITHLDLNGNYLSDEDLEILVPMKNLVHLHVKDTHLNETAIPIFKKFEKLQVLFIKSSLLSDTQIKKIQAALPKVKVE